VPFPPPNASEHARAETERKQRLFDWADGKLADFGLVERVRQASTLEQLRLITFDADAVEVVLAIREALHPASGRKAAHFAGLNEGGLKKILKVRFHEMKKQREQELRSGAGQSAGAGQSGSGADWTDGLQLDDEGGVLPLLANLILFLRHHPAWLGVLGFDEFAARVVIRKTPPWGAEAADAPWTDHHETQTRIWFQHQQIKAGLGDVGRAVQAAARSNAFHPVKDYLESRQCAFAATINPPVGGYLKDPTGDRRFWPFVCGTIDLDGLERDRDHLWAEAVHRYKHRAKWWLETPELEALATAEQRARFKIDLWQPRIERWIGQRKRVRLSAVLGQALRIAEVDQTKSQEMRVASILTHLGFTKRRLGNRHREYCYEREES
jgi:hypothetical protein